MLSNQDNNLKRENMNSNDPKNKKKTKTSDIRNAVQQARPNNDCDTIMKPASKKEVREAVEEINPDENTLDRG